MQSILIKSIPLKEGEFKGARIFWRFPDAAFETRIFSVVASLCVSDRRSNPGSDFLDCFVMFTRLLANIPRNDGGEGGWISGHGSFCNFRRCESARFGAGEAIQVWTFWIASSCLLACSQTFLARTEGKGIDLLCSPADSQAFLATTEGRGTDFGAWFLS